MAMTIGGKTPQSIEIGGKAVHSLAIGGEVVWSAGPVIPDYLCFTANAANSTVGVNDEEWLEPDLEYSTDGVNFTTWTRDGDTGHYPAVTLANAGDKLYIRGNNPSGLGIAARSHCFIEGTGDLSMSGNPTSLFSSTLTDTVSINYAFHHLFQSNPALTSVDLTALDSVTGTSAMAGMFDGCTNLDEVKIATSSWDTSITSYWLNGVSVNGDFFNLGGATIPSGTSGIPSGWTEHTSI